MIFSHRNSQDRQDKQGQQRSPHLVGAGVATLKRAADTDDAAQRKHELDRRNSTASWAVQKCDDVLICLATVASPYRPCKLNNSSNRAVSLRLTLGAGACPRCCGTWRPC